MSALIDEFLARRPAWRSVDTFRSGAREALLRKRGCVDTLKLPEIESRAHFVHEIA